MSHIYRALRTIPRVSQVRNFSVSSRIMAGGAGKNVPTPLGEGHVENFHGMPEPVYDSVPGFPAPGKVASNYDIAVGLERYELLQTLDGKIAFESLLPVVMDRRPTRKNPLVLRGIDHEFYLACSGFPAESHEPVWLTLKDNGYVYRCPTCGCAYKYENVGDHSH